MSATIQYLTDPEGTRTAVLLPLVEYERLLEDLADLSAIADRRDEPTVSHAELKTALQHDGLLGN
jgi:hypothetical protein